MTAGALIERSLRMIGVLASGATPTGPESNDALVTLNGMLEALQLEGRTLYTITRVTKAIVASQASYTIGTGGNINRARPTSIPRASILQTTPSPDIETPILVLSQQQWEDISIKGLESTIPTAIYYNPTNPLGTVHVYPVGTDTTISLVLYIEEPLTALALLTTSLAFPPGYQRWLEYDLGVALCPEYDRPVPPLVLETWKELKANVKRKNLRIPELRCDPGVLSGSWINANIYTGE